MTTVLEKYSVRIFFHLPKPLLFFCPVFLFVTCLLAYDNVISIFNLPFSPAKTHLASEQTLRLIDTQSRIVPPKNLTRQERIEWFRKRLPEFEILKSDDLTSRFQERVQEFLTVNSCKLRFFITWIAPAGSFGNREFLTIETLFSSNPRGCLLVLSRSLDYSTESNRILKPFLERGFKVGTFAPDLQYLFQNTPAEAWFEDLKAGNKDPGRISLAQNLSNLIRLAVLYKYGGVYLDTDFVVLKSFGGLRNSIGVQDSNPVTGKWTVLNQAILAFDKNHPLLLNFIDEFASKFNGNVWGVNGPYLVSRVVRKLEAKHLGSGNFTILPSTAFYPIEWKKFSAYFRKPKADSRWVAAELNRLREETFAVHLWNSRSRRTIIEQGSILWNLISNHCIICLDSYNP